MGYTRIALGGLVPLKTVEIAQVVQAVAVIRRPGVEFHLLGVTRLQRLSEFEECGVTSFDSTSPLRQAFKDDRDNYYTANRTYPAIRVPQVDKNVKLKNKIKKGEIPCEEARAAERRCLASLQAYDREESRLAETLEAVRDYSTLCGLSPGYFDDYREILETRPWDACDCEICRHLGINVIIFRGAERNRRRGFHNLYVFRHRMLAPARSD